jgi:non-ribosomal peptide synthase protein (TIGR01720 family)
VKQTVVSAHLDDFGHSHLVAYVVNRDPARKIDDNELADSLREQLADHMIPAIFVDMHELPLTLHGNVERDRLPIPDFSKTMNAHVAPRTEAEKALCEIWCSVLGLERLGVQDNFFDVGGHSINAIQIAARAKKAGYKVSTKQIFELQTVEKLAAAAAPSISRGVANGFTSLSPIQQWFFERDFSQPNHFNMAMLMELPAGVDSGLLAKALGETVRNHSILAQRFKKTGSGWVQFTAQDSRVLSFTEHDLTDVDGAARDAAMESAAAAAHAGLDLSAGPILQAVLFRLGERDSSCLLIAVHHLYCDITSLSILTQDIQTAYSQLRKGSEVRLEPEGTSYRRWTEQLAIHSTSERCQEQRRYWTNSNWSKAEPIPRDGDGHATGKLAAVQIQLNENETQSLVKDLPRVHKVQVIELLLTGLALAYEGWTGSKSAVVAVERHGREELDENVDLSRTVGWFTAITPMLLDLDGAYDAKAALRRVRDCYRAVPDGGVGFGALRYLSSDQTTREEMGRIPAPEISFNYLGQRDAHSNSTHMPGNGTEQRRGLLVRPSAERLFKLDISGAVERDRLTITIVFSEPCHKRSSVEALALHYAQALRDLIDRCAEATPAHYTVADFPAVQLEQTEIDELVAELGSAGD